MGEIDSDAGKRASGPRPIGRYAYLTAAMPLLLVEYTIVLVVRYDAYYSGHRAGFGALEWLYASGVETTFIVIGTLLLASTAALGWLSVRRAAATGTSELAASLCVVPWLQLFAIPGLAFAREKPDDEARGSYAAMRGALWGLGIALTAEIVLTLVVGEFGTALFVGSPFLVGFVASYIARRDGHPHPMGVAQGALLLASLVLFGFAYEGLLCLAVAYPLAAIAATIGGAAGTLMGRLRADRTTVFSSVALLPLLLVAETADPPVAQFEDIRSVDVAAPPALVWQSIVHMGTIDDAPAAPFGWGLAYPVAGRIDGAGVGAVRRGVFSTGVAFERVTRWEPNRELWFDVLTDPPMMRETNPFAPVRSVHLEGYFATRDARFTLTALPEGRTRLTLATDHSLTIGPTSYFLPLARWAVAENKRRVLAHFRDRAEDAIRAR
jgi:hypothetical protein